MKKQSIASIQSEIKNLKKILSPESICISFLDETDLPGIYQLRENIYRNKADPESRSFQIKANTADEAAEQYQFPQGCNAEKSILFIMDFGEKESE